MSDSTTTPGHIDYREAFVLNMEMAAHGLSCQECRVAAINNNNEWCDRMKFMRAYIKRAYEALPPYYKSRYENATRGLVRLADG